MSLADTSIRLYQQYISRDYNGARRSSCAYWPSCSEHVRRSVEREGLVAGGVHGLERYVSCGPAAHQRNLEEYLGRLHHQPEQALSQTLTDSAEAREHLRVLHDLADRYVPRLERGERLAELEVRQEWAEISRDFELLRLDEPGRQCASTFMVRRRPMHPPAPARTRSQEALITTARWLGSALGASLGALAGAVLGPAGSLALNAAAAGGRLEPVLQGQETHYGRPGVEGLERHLQPVVGPARWIKKHLPGALGTLASGLAGGLWSLPGGLAVGMVGGARAGATFAGSLAANLTAEALGVAAPINHPHLESQSLSGSAAARYNRETSERGDHPCTAEPSTTS